MTTHVTDLPTAQIVPGDNDRTVFGETGIEELANSIAADGLIQPITVRLISPEGSTPLYQIVAGERRFRACSHLGWETIPALVRDLSDEQASTIMLIENVHRKDIDPIDEARAYRKRQQRFGWSSAQVAKKANVTARRVNARLSLLRLTPEIQKLVQHGHMGVGFAECMVELDVNRQRIAMRYFQTGRRPLLREFRAVCSNLLAEQAQEALFDLDAFIQQTVEEHEQGRSGWQRLVFPVDEALPLMKRVGSIGLSFETYIHQLLEAGQHEAAAIVGRVYQGMLEGGMAYPPHGPSPLRSGDTVRP